MPSCGATIRLWGAGEIGRLPIAVRLAVDIQDGQIVVAHVLIEAFEDIEKPDAAGRRNVGASPVPPAVVQLGAAQLIGERGPEHIALQEHAVVAFEAQRRIGKGQIDRTLVLHLLERSLLGDIEAAQLDGVVTPLFADHCGKNRWPSRGLISLGSRMVGPPKKALPVSTPPEKLSCTAKLL